jgi:hypothetical protein
VSYEIDLHAKDGAWRTDAKIAAGVDDVDNTHPLNCTTDGTLEVQVAGTDVPIDVIVDNVVPVSQSGTWTVNLATEPTIDIGIVDQGTPNTLANGWPIKITDGTNVLGTVLNPLVTTGTFVPVSSSTAVVTAVTVTTSPTVLLATNTSRKGFAIQNQDTVAFIKFDSTVTTSLYSYELPRKGILEKDNYNGPVTAVTASGSVTILVTELI